MHTNVSLINVVNLFTALYFSSILTASSPTLLHCWVFVFSKSFTTLVYSIQFPYSWQAAFYTIYLFMTGCVLYNFLTHDIVYLSIFTPLHLCFLQFICCAVFSILRSVCCVLPHIHGSAFHQFTVLNTALFNSLI